MNLKSIILSERRVTKMVICCIIPFIMTVKKDKTTGAGTGDKEQALTVKWSKKIFCDGGWIFFLIMMW